MVLVTIDFNNIVKKSPLKERVRPIPRVSSKLGLILDLSRNNINTRQKGPDRVDYVNSEEFIRFVKGHAFVGYNTDKNTIEIIYIKDISIGRLMPELSQVFPSTAIVWIHTPKGPYETYIKQGFGYPHLSDVSPSGRKLQNRKLCFLKPNTRSCIRNTSAKEVREVLQRKRSCETTLRLTRKAVNYLKNLGDSVMTLNSDGTVSQKEVSGNLRCVKTDGNLTQYLDIDHDTIVCGTEMSVPITPGVYNFHSHHKQAYEKSNLKFAWPSPHDYLMFLRSHRDDRTILHIVSSLEGIYMISAHKNTPVDLPEEYILRTYDLCNQTHLLTPTKYVDIVNKFRPSLFTVQYFPWNKATTKISIVHNKNRDNCFSKNNSWKYYKQMYE